MPEQGENAIEKKESDRLETDKVTRPLEEVTEDDLDPSEIIVVTDTPHVKVIRYARPLVRHVEIKKGPVEEDDQVE